MGRHKITCNQSAKRYKPWRNPGTSFEQRLLMALEYDIGLKNVRLTVMHVRAEFPLLERFFACAVEIRRRGVRVQDPDQLATFVYANAQRERLSAFRYARFNFMRRQLASFSVGEQRDGRALHDVKRKRQDRLHL